MTSAPFDISRIHTSRAQLDRAAVNLLEAQRHCEESVARLCPDGRPFRPDGADFFTVDHVCGLNRALCRGLSENATPGAFRDRRVRLSESNHAPPEPGAVPGHMRAFAERLNADWAAGRAPALAAWALWRLAWIHPFLNGNGRTARLFAWWLICLKYGGVPPGRSVLVRLSENTRLYEVALAEADRGRLNMLSQVMEGFLIEQLQDACSGI